MIRKVALALVLLAMFASPATAAPREAPQLPPEFSDPAMADKLGKMAGALTKALMDMPVGEIEATIEGREPTQADKAKRVRDAIGGPEAEREVSAQVAQSGKQMQAMTKALVASLPSIMAALEGVEKNLDRVTANIPDPTYPKQ